MCNTRVTDALILVVTGHGAVLVLSVEALHEGAKPLGLQVSLRPRPRYGCVDEIVQSIYMCGTVIEILGTFTNLNALMHGMGESYKVFHWIGLAYNVMDSFNTSVWLSWYLCRTNI